MTGWRPAACLLLLGAYANAAELASPDKHLSVRVELSNDHTLRYAVYRDAIPVVLASELGLELEGADLQRGLRLAAVSAVKPVSDSYEMVTGKRRRISYAANEQTFTVHNARQQAMDVVFRVSNDGVAFRYVVGSGPAHKKLIGESSSFTFGTGARAWLQPMQVAQTGWKNTNPAYEEHYQMDIAVGTASPSPAGWVFPALFRSGDNWVLLSESNMDGSYQASRLQQDAAGGTYRLGKPMAPEVYTGGALMAEADGVLTSPWRLMAIGPLATVMDSTLGTDLAAPAIDFERGKVQPGHASWSWALLKDDATVYDVQKKFIDYAAAMRWDYTLIDADWDRKIGYDKVKGLAEYAAAKNVGVLVWYNSSGAWNETEYSPKGRLLTHELRVAEFARLRGMGVKGVKVDFFPGDGKSAIAYYLDILRDAADADLLVNFHGATLPRGWARTYPNLMTAEAVKGLEFTTFTQADQDALPSHAAMLPFARNVFDPMDFTPMVFGDVSNIKRATRNGFELALPVLFLSGIQHMAETPEGMATVPEYVRQFLRELPRSWDDSKFIDGVPGKYITVARRNGETWYVAGINAEEGERTLALDLSFVGKAAATGVLLTDGETQRAFSTRAIGADAATRITVKPHGGFVAVFGPAKPAAD
jgi:hypothetical protein